MEKKFFIKYVLCILSGIGVALAFIYPTYNFLVWFSLTPCLYTLFKLDINQSKHGFFLMLSYGLSFYLILFSWLWALSPLDWCGFSNNLGKFLIFIAWLTLSLFEALFPAIIGFIFCKLSKKIKFRWLTITLLWITMEYLQGCGALGFTWGRLANTQYNNIFILQSVSILGPLFVSGIIVLANSALACYFCNPNRYSYICAFFLIFLANFLYGYNRINSFLTYDTKLNVSLIQANIDNNEKWDSKKKLDMLNIYTSLTKLAVKKSEKPVDVVIWAETAIPTELINDRELFDICVKLSEQIDASILVGTFETVNNKTYNSILEITPNGIESESSHKHNLVPFGEYLPLRNLIGKLLPVLNDLNSLSYDLAFGNSSNLTQINQATIGNIICFDSTFSDIARTQVQNGANILAVETNDSWFNGTAALHQHLSQSVLRAVENHRYVVRTANTGITAVISPTGEILSALEPETQGYINYSVSVIKGKTNYTLYGDIIVLFTFIILICSYLIGELFAALRN